MAAIGGLSPSGRDVTHQAIEAVVRENAYYPVKMNLDALVWDRVERLENWLSDCLGVVKTEYSMASDKIFLTAMSARIFEPGYQGDYC